MLRRWLYYWTSRTYRQSGEVGEAVRKLLELQREDLTPAAVAQLESALANLKQRLNGPRDPEGWNQAAEGVMEAGRKWIRTYPNSSLREYAIMGLELIILVLGSRAFLIQPMEIPTGSAQPTLWGITATPLPHNSAADVPSWPLRLFDLFFKGDAYCFATAEVSGDLQAVGKPRTIIPFIPFCNRATVIVGGKEHTLYCLPDDYGYKFGWTDPYFNLPPTPKHFEKGEPLAAFAVHAGDHLFVERITYNFRRPRRGEIIVFRSEQHPGMTTNTHYIKRLVGLGGEIIRIGDDRHVYINGKQLTTNDSGFDNVYSFDPSTPPRPDHYSGHVNEKVARQMAHRSAYSFNFPDGETEFPIRPGHYVCFGDNTMNSADSRYWPVPDFPQEQVIGKYLFVFWPFTDRFGWGRH